MSRSAPSGTYKGEDLARSSARAGAYDAFDIPSRMNGERVSLKEQKAQLCAPIPQPAPATAPEPAPTSVAWPPPTALAAPQPPERRPAEALPIPRARRAPTPRPRHAQGEPPPYVPRHGSVPQIITAHLTANGGCLRYEAASAMTGVPTSNIPANCRSALRAGTLKRYHIDGRPVLALPDWRPPEKASQAEALQPPAPSATPPAPAAPAPDLPALIEQLRDQLARATASIHAASITLRVLAALVPSPAASASSPA